MAKIVAKATPKAPIEPIFEEKGLTRELDYHQILLWHINRIGIYIAEMDQNPMKFISGVDYLRALFVPFIDKKYKKDNEEIKRIFKRRKKSIIEPDGRPNPKRMMGLEFDKAMMEFKIIMELMGRKGLLPKESVEMVI